MSMSWSMGFFKGFSETAVSVTLAGESSFFFDGRLIVGRGIDALEKDAVKPLLTTSLISDLALECEDVVRRLYAAGFDYPEEHSDGYESGESASHYFFTGNWKSSESEPFDGFKEAIQEHVARYALHYSSSVGAFHKLHYGS